MQAVPTVGFLFVHLGIVVILVGAFSGYLFGNKGMLQLQLLHPVSVSGLEGEEAVPFGFEVTAKDFAVEFYPPVYHLYRQLPPEQIVPGQMPFLKVREFDAAGKTVWNLDGFGPFTISNLRNEATGGWAPRRMLDSGSFLHRASQTPAHYGVTLQISDGEKEIEHPVSVNHPADYKGWRFYLMSYDQRERSFVVLSARHDPGRGSVIAGFWTVIVGMFILCFRKTGVAA